MNVLPISREQLANIRPQFLVPFRPIHFNPERKINIPCFQRQTTSINLCNLWTGAQKRGSDHKFES